MEWDSMASLMRSTSFLGALEHAQRIRRGTIKNEFMALRYHGGRDLDKAQGRGEMVRAEGLEPPHLTAPDPKSGVSANFTTRAKEKAVEEGSL